MEKAWHKNFNPQRFLAGIDVEKLISKNKTYPENDVASILNPCIICGKKEGSGIVLNDKSFLCKPCFQVVSLIEYPERYEKLRRAFLINKEAWNCAKRALVDASIPRKISRLFSTLTGLTVLLVFWNVFLIAAPVVCFAISKFGSRLHDEKIKLWEAEIPVPIQPLLRHFHDPEAELTSHDELILHIFNHWPGYPPFWNYLREVVLMRDGHRCQVTGCPSRLELHIHHKIPVAKGGPHAPMNLIALCDFHHALEPESGHERIWSNIKTRYFTLVREHLRSNRASPGKHEVSTHLRRLELVSEREVAKLSETYGFCCPHCGSDQIRILVLQKRNIVQVECRHCGGSIEGPQELTEETGPRLAEALKPTRCMGVWKPRWDMLSERKKTGWGDWSRPNVSSRRKDYQQRRQAETTKPLCPRCGSPMRLIKPKPGDRWKPFWGCTQFRVNGCKGAAIFTGEMR